MHTKNWGHRRSGVGPRMRAHLPPRRTAGRVTAQMNGRPLCALTEWLSRRCHTQREKRAQAAGIDNNFESTTKHNGSVDVKRVKRARNEMAKIWGQCPFEALPGYPVTDNLSQYRSPG